METEKMVIMAALNLAHDLLKATERNKKALPNEADESKINLLIELCDSAL